MQESRRRKGAFTLVTAILVGAFALYRSSALPESDLLWEIRTGQLTLSSGTIPRSEIWSWLIEGKDWLPNSWLWNVLLAGVYGAGGVLALCAFSFILYCITFALAWNLLRQLKMGYQARLIILVLLAFCGLGWMTIRPQQADYLLLLVWLNLLPWLNSKPLRLRLAVLLPSAFLLTAAWMNFHLSATAACLLFPASYWFSAQLQRESLRSRALISVAILLVSLAGLLATPFGLDGITKGGSVLAESRGLLSEWSPITFSQLRYFPQWISVLGLASFGIVPLVLAIRKKLWLAAVFLGTFVILGQQIPRFIPLLILTSLIFTPLLPRTFREATLRNLPLAVLSSAMVLTLALSSALPKVLDPGEITILNPADLTVIPQHARVLTMPEGGGMLILHRPDTSPSLDSRNDLYGRDLYLRIMKLFYVGDRLEIQSFLDNQKVNAVYEQTHYPKGAIMPTINRAMAQLHWKRYVFEDATIWVRPGA